MIGRAPGRVVLLAATAVFLLAACSGAGGSRDRRLRVVTSVSPITSLAENVGGTRIKLQGLIPEGVNSHTYEPPVSDVRELADADLIILNGLHLEEPLRELAEANKKDGAEIILLGDAAITPNEYKYDFSFPRDRGNPNPHVWPDVVLAMEYTRLIHDALVRLDPANASYYGENLGTLLTRMQDLDAAIREAVASIPPGNRKLLTYHDSFAYFADEYGMTVIGAIQPSDFAEPSAREVADLIDQVKREKVPAIFGSEVFPSPL